MSQERVHLKCVGLECKGRPEDERCDAEPLHSCPYQEEINEDYSDHCTCCSECRIECLYEI